MKTRLLLLLAIMSLAVESYSQGFTRHIIIPYSTFNSQTLDKGRLAKDSLKDKRMTPTPSDSTRWEKEKSDGRKEFSRLVKDEFFKLDSAFIYGGAGSFANIGNVNTEDLGSNVNGSIGFNLVSSRISTDLYFTFNPLDTIEITTLNNFGSALFSPNIRGRGITLNSNIRLKKSIGCRIGYQASKSLWKFGSDYVEASPLTTRIGIYYKPFDCSAIVNNKINLTLNLDYVNRSIKGDFANNTFVVAGQIIDPTVYHGLDFAINFLFNDINFYYQYSINRKKPIDIPGYSGTQVTFGINVSPKLTKL